MLKGLRKKSRLIQSVLPLFFLTQTVNANTYQYNDEPSLDDYDSGRKFVTLMVGKERVDLDNKTLSITKNSSTYKYYPHGAVASHIIMGGFFGWEAFSTEGFRLVTGLSYFQPHETEIDGVEVQSATTYRYKYKMLFKQLLLEGKLYFSTATNLEPFISAGIGFSRNKLYAFENTNPAFNTTSHSYNSVSKNNLSYDMSIGFNLMLTEIFHLEFAYRYTSYGANKGKYDIHEDVALPYYHGQPKLRSQQLLTQLTYAW